MDDVIVKLNEKLESSVKRLRDGTHDDHDILPALLWALLEYNRSHRNDLEQLQQKAVETSAEINSLVRALPEECAKLQRSIAEDLRTVGDDLNVKLGSLNTRVDSLAQALQEKCDKLQYQLESVASSIGTILKTSNEDLKQTVRQSATQLQKLVEARVDGLSEAHQSGLRRTDKKLTWLLIGSLFQIVFILIVIFFVFGK